MSERIGIIAANNIRFSPYIQLYSNIFDELCVDYDLIYPDRNGLEDEWHGVKHTITWYKKVPSILNYKLYTNKVIGIIKRNHYSKLIVLTTVNAVYMAYWLNRFYKNKYIVDIRDYTYEFNGPYAFLEKKALQGAWGRVISSEMFKRFLPNLDYILCNNLHINNLDQKELIWQKHTDPIIIGYVGSVAYEHPISELIKRVKNDERFQFHIYGGGPRQEIVSNTVEDANCERIKYHGKYLPEEKSSIIENVDILFNAYGNNSPRLLFALSNKLYDAMYYKKLLLNSPGTYMEELSGFCGYSIDFEKEGTLDSLYNWYMNLDDVLVTQYQDRMLDRFINENKFAKEKIVAFTLSD